MFDFLSEKFSNVFARLTGRGTLTEGNIQEALDKVSEALLEADVPQDVVRTFVQNVQQEVIGHKVMASLKPGEQFIKIVHQRLLDFLGGTQAGGLEFSFQIPSTIMVMGLQGSGKTTSLAKIAHLVKKQAVKHGKDRRILCASVDFYRPAAIDQLEVLAKQVNVGFYRAMATEPVKAANEIADYAKKNHYELILLDTAGRLHVDNALLAELQHIDSSVKPKYKLLVLDAMTGQESLHVAQAFEAAVPFQYAVLTKMDSDTRGGAAFAFRYVLHKPILFTGVGEKIDDLEQFYPERMADRILGMGDVLSLIEKAQEKIKQEEHDKMRRSFQRGSWTLQDFADQMDMMGRLGSLSTIAKYLPGMGGAHLSPEMLEKGEAELKKFKAIISSMTKKERIYPRVLDASRKTRVAQGAGVQVRDINTLLQRFEESQQFAKLFKKFGRL
jgi:signal recognition particle subunit SRP54